jgi:hypothetical protein
VSKLQTEEGTNDPIDRRRRFHARRRARNEDDENDVDDDDDGIDREGIDDGEGPDEDWGDANAANIKDLDGFEEAREDATGEKTVRRDEGERWELDRVENV